MVIFITLSDIIFLILVGLVVVFIGGRLVIAWVQRSLNRIFKKKIKENK